MNVERVKREARRCLPVVLGVAVCLLAPSRASMAQSVAVADRDALVRLRVDRGGRAEEVDALIRQADAAGSKGLPVAPLMNKIREGLAKGYEPKRIEAVIGSMMLRMETADRIVREVEPGVAVGARDSAVTLLEEALFSGLTTDEIRELQRQAQIPALSSQELAGAAKGLSFIKESRLPVTEGTAVMAEAVRQKFRPYEMLDLGREIKRREADYRAGRASLRALRDAIARGTRPDALLRDSRAVVAARPAAARPDATTDRPERPAPVERPQRADRPADRPASPAGDRAR